MLLRRKAIGLLALSILAGAFAGSASATPKIDAVKLRVAFAARILHDRPDGSIFSRPRAVSRPVAPAPPVARGASATPPQQIATYPRDGDPRVASTATLYFVFDQPTSKSGSFSVADLDSGTVGVLLNLESPRWSALGDTVFLKPIQPMTFGHHHGMRVNTIIAADGVTAANDLPIVYFTVFPRARVERIVSMSEGHPLNSFASITLVPGRPIPVSVNVRELNQNTATFTSAIAEFWTSASADLSGGETPVPIRRITIPIDQRVPAGGSARLSVPVTLPIDLARQLASGTLGLRLLFEGYDETGLPLEFDALSTIVSRSPTDSTLTMTEALITPPIASNVVVESAFLEEPLPGAVFAAGDTVRARGVVTGIGTGPFRAVFFLDGDAVAMEEGYMEAGRPVVVEPRGPIVSRRQGEHRLHFVVEMPQNVAARPITFLCVPPPHGITQLPPKPKGAEGDSAGADSVPPPAPPPPAPPRLSIGGTYLVVGKSGFREESGAGLAWSAWQARYEVSKTASLNADIVWRLRVDDPKNGSAAPEQMQLRYQGRAGSLEWGDVAPGFAESTPLLASSVPRRSAQAAWAGSAIGRIEGYAALESRPRSAAGLADSVPSDLYAARWSRSFGGRLSASLYGGYTHTAADPISVASDSVPLADAIYGGSGRLSFGGDWTLTGDIATVHHEALEGSAPSRSRTGMRGSLEGEIAGFEAKAEAFQYHPDLATPLNPYALSDRRGGGAEIARKVANWRFFGSYRGENPVENAGAPKIRVDRWTFGGRLALNSVSWVTPEFIRIQHHGLNSEFRESRAAGELVIGEPYHGETKARLDVTLFEDDLGTNTRRVLTSASVVSTRRHPGGVTSTLSGGYEHDDQQRLDLSDQTLQGTIEIRWEAIPGKFLVSPFITYLSRDYESLDRREDHVAGRLQLAWVHLPGLGNNALSLEGRIDRSNLQKPIEEKSTEGSVLVTFGQRFDLTSTH